MRLRPTRRGARSILLSIAVSGCVGGATIIPPPSAPRSVEAVQPVRVERPTFRLVLEPVLIDPLEVEVRVDEILSSPVLGDRDFDAAVDDWIAYWQVTASPWFPDFLRRMTSFEERVDSALAESGLPPSLRYLPFIESGYNPRASSSALAVGLWQFMQPTVEELGMVVTPLFDERRDPIKSTEAAVGFLADLRKDFDSWFLALAAYNSGPNRVRRILARYAPEAERTDSLFWALRGHFPRETREFIPKLIGAVLVAGSPALYGYDAPVSAPFRFDPVSVPDATTLDVVARAAEVPEAEIVRLNPEFVRGLTPPGRTSTLRVPEGRGPTFVLNYARIPAEERVTFVEHRVTQGETLSHIAVRYGVRVADLRAANPDVRPRFLRIGAVLTVPVAPSVRRAQAPGT